MSLSNGSVSAAVGGKPSAPNFAIAMKFAGDSALPVGYHHARLASASEILSVPTTLALALSFLNDMKAKVNTHLASTDAHEVASAASVAAPDATDQGTADTLAAEIVADFNTHRTEATVHVEDDVTNVMVDSTDGTLANLLVTCASIAAFWAAHEANTIGTAAFTAFVRATAGVGSLEILGVVDGGCGLYVPRYYRDSDRLGVFVRTTGLAVAGGTDLSGTTFNIVVIGK